MGTVCPKVLLSTQGVLKRSDVRLNQPGRAADHRFMGAERDIDEQRVAGLVSDYSAATTLRSRAAVIVRMGQEPDDRLATSRADFLHEIVSEPSDDLGEKTWLAAATALMAFEMQNQIEIYWDWRTPFTDFIREDAAKLLAQRGREHPEPPQEAEPEEHAQPTEAPEAAATPWDRFVEWWNKVDPE